jgi:hypothetical protein
MTDKEKLDECIKKLNSCAYVMGMHSGSLYNISRKYYITAEQMREDLQLFLNKMGDDIYKLFYSEK